MHCYKKETRCWFSLWCMAGVLLVYCVENYIQVSQARYKEGKKICDLGYRPD
jgi:hypothetical protein